jgi:SAM-dependent methyltransferase
MSSRVMRPDEIALEEHRDYYSAGGYDEDRLRWTVATFLSDCRGKRVLEIGCGDGKLLALLREDNNEVQGIEASATGVEKCAERGIAAHCMDVSSQPLPFPDDHFDVVISLETIEHLMNPYYALLQIRRVLKENAVLICSVPNPATGHPYLYPGLFSFPNFSEFLTQIGWRIERVEPWQWAPRESILPARLRGNSLLASRYVAGLLRRAVEHVWRMTGHFPWFCYWLWTFQCVNVGKNAPTILEKQVHATKPGSPPAQARSSVKHSIRVRDR